MDALLTKVITMSIQLPSAPNGRVNTSNRCTTSDEALLAAWWRFLVYDAASIHQKAIHSRIRKLIIYIGVIISFLVMLSSVKDKLPQIGYFSVFIKYGLIVLPIVVAAVMAYATQFTPSLAWGKYPVSAETIRREIYLYRMKAGDYATELEEKHSTMLLNKVNAVVNGVGVLGSLTAKYKVLGKDIPSIVKTKTDNPADDGFN